MSEDTTDDTGGDEQSARGRLEEEKDRAVAGFDQGVVDILSWVLDTETRARIFVYLRQHPWSTSEEVADGTGLYPSTVREALAELADEDVVERRKRQSEGAGNNPYEYTAIPPSDLVGGVIDRVQDELNTVFNLDAHLGRSTEDGDSSSEPVRIEVEDGFEAEAEVGDTDASVETDVDVEAAGGDGDGGVDIDVEAEAEVDDTEAGVEGGAEIGDVDDNEDGDEGAEYDDRNA
ncbi:MAG: helix-turn-helix domain-containing protein [Halobacterium sp.]